MTVPRILWLCQVAAGAAVGGLLAVALVAVIGTIDRPRLVNLVVVAVTGLCVVAAMALTAEDARPQRDQPPEPPEPSEPPPWRPPPSQPEPPEWEPWHQKAARGVAGKSGPTVPPPAPTSRPAPPPPAPPAPTAPATDRARSAVPAPTLIPLGDPPPGRPVVRQVVQCPRCADFDLAVQQLRHELGFTCRACGHGWHWRPGDPWPVTVVRPELARTHPKPAEDHTAVWHLNG